jgi:hypothetical protein
MADELNGTPVSYPSPPTPAPGVQTQEAVQGLAGNTTIPDPFPAPTPPTSPPVSTAPVPKSVPPAPSAPTYDNTDVGFRAAFRANIEWVIKETDLHTVGATPWRRESDNPINPNPKE